MTKGALIQRVSRALAKEGEILKKSRGMQMFLNVGEYYAIDLQYNAVSRKNINLEDLGRELGVLRPYEVLSAND